MPLFKIQASYKPTAEIETFIGDKGHLFYSEEDRILRISDGETPGGIPVSAGEIGSGDGIVGFTPDEINQIIYLNSGWDLVPTNDNQQSLGAPDKRWKDIYVSGGTIFIGDDLQIGQDPSTGQFEMPAGAVLKNPDGTSAPVATLDVDSIDWNSVLAGVDLGLEYATTSYVDGKTRTLANKTYVDDTVQTAIDGINLEDQAVRLLTELEDVDAQNLLDKAYLQYNPQTGKWEANTSLHYDVITLTTDVEDLQTGTTNLLTTIANIQNDIANFEGNITNVINSVTEVRESISDLSLTDLGNVQSGRPASGSLLQYNGEAQEWQPTNNVETPFGSLRLNGGSF